MSYTDKPGYSVGYDLHVVTPDGERISVSSEFAFGMETKDQANAFLDMAKAKMGELIVDLRNIGKDSDRNLKGR